jgi:hypothetical protein
MNIGFEIEICKIYCDIKKKRVRVRFEAQLGLRREKNKKGGREVSDVALKMAHIRVPLAVLPGHTVTALPAFYFHAFRHLSQVVNLSKADSQRTLQH